MKGIIVDRPNIPYKAKKAAPEEADNTAQQNGKHALNGAAPDSKGVKRSLDQSEDDGQPLKKARHTEPAADDVVVVEDAGGAIVIDDD